MMNFGRIFFSVYIEFVFCFFRNYVWIDVSYLIFIISEVFRIFCLVYLNFVMMWLKKDYVRLLYDI